jgi:hypothetical protein
MGVSPKGPCVKGFVPQSGMRLEVVEPLGGDAFWETLRSFEFCLKKNCGAGCSGTFL